MGYGIDEQPTFSSAVERTSTRQPQLDQSPAHTERSGRQAGLSLTITTGANNRGVPLGSQDVGHIEMERPRTTAGKKKESRPIDTYVASN